MAKSMAVGDRVKNVNNNRVLVLTEKLGRDPLDRRRTLFGAKGLEDRLPTQVNSGEVVKF